MNFAQGEINGLIVRTAPLGPIATNCYVVACARTLIGAIIDCSAEPERITEMIEASPALKISALLQTHAHIDHVAALSAMKAKLGAPIHVHASELPLYDAAPTQGLMLNMRVSPLPRPDVFLKEGEVLELGNLRARVLETPGHTPGGVCFYFEAQAVLFTGDLLFAGSIGRTDLPGGHFPTIEASLARMKELPEETIVLSGHGPQTSIGRELKVNPFLR